MVSRQVLNNIYNDLLELSSISTQREKWILGTRTGISSYIELMNRLYDDDDLGKFIKEEIILLGASETFISCLQDLDLMLNSYDDKGQSREQIIEDKDWIKITEKAKEVLNFWDRELGKGEIR